MAFRGLMVVAFRCFCGFGNGLVPRRCNPEVSRKNGFCVAFVAFRCGFCVAFVAFLCGFLWLFVALCGFCGFVWLFGVAFCGFSLKNHFHKNLNPKP